jgi:D-tyrosyl-tRNA(Tyr) deacylase
MPRLFMKAVIQRVTQASVDVDGQVVGQIGPGLLVLLGVAKGDSESDVQYVADKLVGLRVFGDEHGKMNRSVKEIGGALLVVSQFTLLGDIHKGRRPGFDHAAQPDHARAFYETAVKEIRARGVPVETGSFGAHMKIHLVNDGPVTFILDSRHRS